MRVCYACPHDSRLALAGLQALQASEHDPVLVLAHVLSGNWLETRVPLVDLPLHLAITAARGIRPAAGKAVPGAPDDRKGCVERFCRDHGIPVIVTGSRRIADHRRAIADCRPDVILSVGWAFRIPQSVCRLARVEAINCHGGLLPAYRGAGATYAALVDGAPENGLTAHVIEPAFDSGPILARKAFPVSPSATAGQIWRRRSDIVGSVILAALDVAGRPELYEPNPPSPYYERCAAATYLRRRLANRLRRALGLPVRRYEPSCDYAGCPEQVEG
jgi:folate-dependent phosphoribosylglycinamide formyltransferase PurN